MRRTARILAALGAATMLGQPGAAHDFWLMPSQFAVAPGEKVRISFNIGHGNAVEPWRVTWERLQSLRSHGPGGVTDQQAAVTPGSAGVEGRADVSLAGAGTHMVVMESYHATSDLPADRFNAYTKLEGLTAAIEHRERTGATAKNGREIYSRRAKTLVQVGDVVSDDVLRPVGMTLEIVPERNPYAASSATELPVRVLLHGRPLAGALIDLTALGMGTEPFQGQRTDADGRATFRVPRAGMWKINTIWARPVEGRTDTDFDTVFSSLTFGYPAGTRAAAGK